MIQRLRLWFMVVAAVFAPLLSAQRELLTPSIPTWALYLDNHMTVAIPLRETGRPFTVEGQIVDTSNNAVRQFIQTAVDKQFFAQSFTPFERGTYRLIVTITDNRGVAVTLGHFPPLTVPSR